MPIQKNVLKGFAIAAAVATSSAAVAGYDYHQYDQIEQQDKRVVANPDTNNLTTFIVTKAPSNLERINNKTITLNCDFGIVTTADSNSQSSVLLTTLTTVETARNQCKGHGLKPGF